MVAKIELTREIHNPVAISDKELLSATSFTIWTFELSTMCGARFGIGCHGACNNNERATDETEELPRKLTEIPAKDHRHNRAYKPYIDLDF